MWTRREALRAALYVPGALLLTRQGALAAKDFWNAKPASDWSSDEVEHLLSNSPWAKEVRAAFESGPGGFGGGNRGGYGGNRGGGGMGYPTGGIGFPGGGIGMPGGSGRTGGGYPSGSGYPPSGGGGYPGGAPTGSPRNPRGESGEPTKATIRWETALPIQEALRSGSSGSNTAKPNPDFDKYYIIHVLGDIPAFGGAPRRGVSNNDDYPRGTNNRRPRNEDDDLDIDSRAAEEQRLEMLKQYTKLERKSGPIFLEKFERGSRTGDLGPGSYFYFSRLDDISMDDKEVTFITKMGPMEIKAKFPLKDMVYHGKLSL
jgi:hypothetical protein